MKFRLKDIETISLHDDLPDSEDTMLPRPHLLDFYTLSPLRFPTPRRLHPSPLLHHIQF